MPLKTTAGNHGEAAKGRGATINLEGRFEKWSREASDDGWFQEPGDEPAKPRTVIAIERAKSIITRNDSPDIGFSQSLNPYRGCGIGCPFCYARPSHAYLGLSPGLDWETRLSAKTNAAELLREELAKRGYRCEVIAIGVNTDAYQPIEREYKITRSILEVAVETRHPVGLITKSALIERDIDLIADLAKDNLVSVTITVVTLDHGISRYLEPRSSAPARRAGGDPRGLEGSGGQHGLVHAAAAPLGGEGRLQGVARGALPAQGRPRDVARARDARRPRQRPELRQPHEGPGPLGGAPSPAFRERVRAVRVEPGTLGGAQHRALQAAGKARTRPAFLACRLDSRLRGNDPAPV
jgi:hypothetical protein